ncbi:MAG: TlpA disulfide reductase family protein [Acidobacteriota bacterium]
MSRWAWFLGVGLVLLPGNSVPGGTANHQDTEKKIIEYLNSHMKPGEPVVVSKLFNEVFTTPEERKVLDKLYNSFFKVPLFVAEFQARTNRPPSLREIAEQFQFHGQDTVNVILKIVEYDRRVPKFFVRSSETGEIRSVDLEKIKADPRFNKAIERSLTGWEGKTAPPFRLQAFEGREIGLDDYKGKTRLVYFWFLHCPPCVQITPHLVSLHEKLKDRGFVVLGLNADRVLELDYADSERKDYLTKHGVNFPVAHLTAEVQQAYGGVQLFPTLFLVDKEGLIRAHFVNYQDEATLEKAIRSVL